MRSLRPALCRARLQVRMQSASPQLSPGDLLKAVAEGAGYAAATVTTGAEHAHSQLRDLSKEAAQHLQRAAAPSFAAERLDDLLLSAVRMYTARVEDAAALDRLAAVIPPSLQSAVRQESAAAASDRYLADHGGDADAACDAYLADCYPPGYSEARSRAAAVGAGGVVDLLEGVTYLKLAAFCAAAHKHDLADPAVQARILACLSPAEHAEEESSGVVAARITARLRDPFSGPLDAAQVMAEAKARFAAASEADGAAAESPPATEEAAAEQKQQQPARAPETEPTQ
eukprot:TRINITY_DN43650_c0_g1_i1.p2 TRINITY_DN43650_c0_g1~~TRINITY_DN43650_c0_g1_i1.p2  ORF type:complete len:286 (+),score=107.41 TRINITY_DN43650_c0_g1_i1:101-958(+)